MVLQDDYLINVAKAVAGESFDTLVFTGYSDQDGNISTSDNALTNEIGSRSNAITSRSDKIIEYDSTRSAADVVDTANGDDIEQIGFFTQSSGDNMQIFVDVANINHTTDFDIEITQQVTVDRQ
jgi:hypothetical protein